MEYLEHILELISEGKRLKPHGNSIFDGYNNKKQPEFLTWRLQAIEALRESMPFTSLALREIEEDQGSQYLYESSVIKILGALTALESHLTRSKEKKNTMTTNILKENTNKIFIVHGHDNETKFEVARFIEKIDLEPIILHEQANGSKTIIEKIEAYSDVGFGIVIYTPCDVGAKKADIQNLQGRARQNVVFEHGFLIGKLGRKNVCPLIKGTLETPNDISGIVYTSMDSLNWKIELAKELRNSGYSVDMNKVI